MASYLPGRMKTLKRKELDDVSDGFSEFSLLSPSIKMRRLDVELPSVMQEEPAVPLVSQQQLLSEQIESAAPEVDAVVEDVPLIPVNEERAIVLYKPIDTPLYLSPSSSNVSFTVSSDMLPGLKNQAFLRQNSNLSVSNLLINCKEAANDTLAVAPWAPTQASATSWSQVEGSSSSVSIEPMEAEEEGASMEVEEESEQASSAGSGAGVFQQWQRQHCMTPEIPTTTTTTPVMWSW
ncbi:hypothetical protein IHE45_08G088500 [Dioscorea alata]|uniref:Uncharacterized protein n=1 Tax=Dioscorea alata TaxID=55571 RepID=A0ACB7VKK1_DIOAL|nr:hypothetical protein IHE45_08G088500 [Dioscorea alata]